MKNKISLNKNYDMFSLDESNQDFDFLKKYIVNTLYVSDGNIELKISKGKEDNIIFLSKGKAIVFTSNVKITLIKNQAKIIIVSSLDNNKEIIEIEDNEGIRAEKKLINYRLIETPKKVVKPWGHEIWISWFKNHHVLKKIFMMTGNKCSLQFHREKSETNLIVEGKARVMKGIIIEENLDEKRSLEKFNSIENINEFISDMSPGNYWSNVPNEIHRVFSINDYTAYEASTPELDDVVRIVDDSNRSSGLLLSEHQK